LFGFFNADYEIWVDGSKQFEGSGKVKKTATYPVSFERLAEKRTLLIAVHIHHNLNSSFPDWMAGNIGIGFYSLGQVLSFERYWLFQDHSSRLFVIGIYFLLTALFFFFWLSARKKQEYFYAALFTGVYGLLQVLLLDYVKFRLDRSTLYFLEFLFTFYQTGFVFFLGLSFARAKKVVFQYGIPVILFFPFIVFVFSNSAGKLLSLAQLTGQSITPIACFLSFFVCCSQAFLIKQSFEKSMARQNRYSRLLTFGFLILVFGIIHYIDSANIAQAYRQVYFINLLPLILILFMSAVVLSDYRDQEIRASKREWMDEYHRPDRVGNVVSGVIISFDLKQSSIYFRRRANEHSEASVATAWRLHILRSLYERGAAYVKSIGDEGIAFFDDQKFLDPIRTALETVSLFHFETQVFEGMYNITHETKILEGLKFRVAVTYGQLRPVNENVQDTKQVIGNEWWEAGSATPFVDLNRLFKIEKKICETANQNHSTLILKSKHTGGKDLGFAHLKNNHLVKNLKIKPDVHSDEYEVDIYSLSATVAKGIKEVA